MKNRVALVFGLLATLASASVQAWTLTTMSSNATSEGLCLAVDKASGIHHVAHSFDNDIYYITNSTGAWPASSTLVGLNHGFGLGCALDSLGKFYISYYDFGRADNWLGYYTNSTGSWVNKTLNSNALYDNDKTSLAIDAADGIHIAYYDNNAYDLRYLDNTSGTWMTADSTSETLIDSAGTVGSQLSIAVDSVGASHIAYYDTTNTALKYATDVSGSWVTTTIESANEAGLYPSIAVDADDNVHISYFHRTGASGYDLKYATNASGSWVTAVIDDGNIGHFSTSITTTSPTAVHISYYDNSNAKLKYATNITGSWEASDVDTGSVGSLSSIAADADGNVSIAYYDAANSAIKLATNSCGNGIVDESEECDGDEGCGETCEYSCGNGNVDTTEECDDEDSDETDSCLSTCESASCGDGKIWNTDGGAEACDDDGTSDGDGCSAACAVESGYTCVGTPSVCTTTCGDGVIAGAETCDDSDATSGDGCSSSCTVESGYTCVGLPSVCSKCGDSVISGSEACDDGDATSGDGCSSSCTVESGYACVGLPSVCTTTCGDRIIAGVETCDDGDADDSDSCPSSAADSAKTYCRTAFCGDGFIWSADGGSEECDSGESPPVDGDGCSAGCKIEHPPVANAGPDQTVVWPIGYSVAPNVLLDGSRSTDPDLDRIYFKWTFSSVPAGSALTNASIVDANKARATFRPDVRGPYTLLLTVTDQDGDTATDTVVIRVTR